MSVFFGGRLIVSPATASLVDDSAMRNTNVNVGNVLAVVGKALGGAPFVPLSFGSASEARAMLRGGEMLTAIERAFDASTEVAGPATVIALRVDPATGSSLSLRDAVSATSMVLTSAVFGAFASQIKVKVETGSVRGKKVTVQLGTDYYTGDNLARDAFSVAYVGASPSAAIDVTDTAVTLIEGGTVVVALSVVDFPTVQSMSDRIGSQIGWVSVVLDASGELPSAATLDSVSSGAVTATPVAVTASVDAIVRWFNSGSSPLVNATRGGGAIRLPLNAPFAFLVGGSNGTATLSNFQQAFDALQSVDVQWVVPVTSNSAVHAMTLAHVDFMSNVARRERRAIVGTATGTSDADAITLAKGMNSDRVSLVHLGSYDYGDSGALQLYPPYILAALLAGAFSGANPGTALTNKSVKVRGLERKLRNPTDTDKLILGGVLCVEETAKGFRVVKSISTWLTNLNYNRVEVSCGVAVDYTSRAVREVLDELRGAKGTPATLADAVSRTDSVLRRLAVAEPMGPGILAGDDANPAFKNITATLDGDVLRVEFQASPVIPLNYVTVVLHAVPYSGTASA